MAAWCRRGKGTQQDEIVVMVHVQPGAKVTAAAGEYDGVLKVRLAAPPVDGKANEALCQWLAAALGLPRRSVSLKSGQTSRRKTLVLAAAGRDPDAVAAVLLATGG
ncbi:DUF167 domain-containing protein [Cupriavidus basilensis]|uniref:UPF0235 protein P3W85_21820 n=1 Tax=Cupriavidus basilensis TaxID=68895 RepID=A0ABT6ASX3_9BURK|nr:DUF167 domain-containing protein [Cupriavidus basilensis]MDF3835569.1 DUF167 domain-containing protein [Cupriavidus basilensis]